MKFRKLILFFIAMALSIPGLQAQTYYVAMSSTNQPVAGTNDIQFEKNGNKNTVSFPVSKNMVTPYFTIYAVNADESIDYYSNSALEGGNIVAVHSELNFSEPTSGGTYMAFANCSKFQAGSQGSWKVVGYPTGSSTGSLTISFSNFGDMTFTFTPGDDEDEDDETIVGYYMATSYIPKPKPSESDTQLTEESTGVYMLSFPVEKGMTNEYFTFYSKGSKGTITYYSETNSKTDIIVTQKSQNFSYDLNTFTDGNQGSWIVSNYPDGVTSGEITVTLNPAVPNLNLNFEAKENTGGDETDPDIYVATGASSAGALPTTNDLMLTKQSDGIYIGSIEINSEDKNKWFTFYYGWTGVGNTQTYLSAPGNQFGEDIKLNLENETNYFYNLDTYPNGVQGAWTVSVFPDEVESVIISIVLDYPNKNLSLTYMPLIVNITPNVGEMSQPFNTSGTNTFEGVLSFSSNLKYDTDFTISIVPKNDADGWTSTSSSDLNTAYSQALPESLYKQYTKLEASVVDGFYTSVQNVSVGDSYVSNGEYTYNISASFPCSGLYQMSITSLDGSNYLIEQTELYEIEIYPNLLGIFGNKKEPGFNINGYTWLSDSDSEGDSAGATYSINFFTEQNKDLDIDWDDCIGYIPGTYFASSFTTNSPADVNDKAPENGIYWTHINLEDFQGNGSQLKVEVEKNGAKGSYIFVINKNATEGNVSPTGVEDITIDSDSEGEVEYFNLQGVRVANPDHGIYIMKRGNEVKKVVK